MNGQMKQISPDDEMPTDILEMLWRDHKLNAIDNPYGSCHARIAVIQVFIEGGHTHTYT